MVEVEAGVTDRVAGRLIPFLMVVLENYGKADIVRREDGGAVETGGEAGETFRQVVAIAHQSEGERVALDLRAGVDLAGEILLRVIEKLRQREVEGDVFADNVEVDLDAVGGAAFGEMLGDGSKMELAADLGGEIFQHGDVAAFADQSEEAFPQIAGEPGVRHLDSGHGDAFDHILPVDVAFRDVLQERLAAKEADCGTQEEAGQEEAGQEEAVKDKTRKWGPHRAVFSTPRTGS